MTYAVLFRTGCGLPLPHSQGIFVRPNQTLRALGLATVLALSVAACGGHGEEPKSEEKAAGGQTVTVVTASSQNLDRTVTASGTISAWEEVPIGAETGGLTATAVLVDEGSYVRQGQPLVQLNTAVLSAQVRQQQAALQTAQANAARDDAALARAQELKERGFLSQASLDTALANQRSSQAGVAQARASLSQSQTQLSQATIRAPVSGLIISRSVTRGQIVAAGTELFRMVRDGRLELDARVPETELGLIRAGQAAAVFSDQAGQTPGQVRIVTSEVDPETRLGVARIALTNPGVLRPGMFARATINVGAQPAMTVPTQALLYRDNKAGVFVMTNATTVRFQPVTVLSRSEARTAVEGLAASARVVVDGAGFLADGDTVRIVAPRTAAPAAVQPAATSASQ